MHFTIGTISPALDTTIGQTGKTNLTKKLEYIVVGFFFFFTTADFQVSNPSSLLCSVTNKIPNIIISYINSPLTFPSLRMSKDREILGLGDLQMLQRSGKGRAFLG